MFSFALHIVSVYICVCMCLCVCVWRCQVGHQVGGPSCVSSLSAAVAVGVGINYSINEARLDIADLIGDQRRWQAAAERGDRQLLALRSH